MSNTNINNICGSATIENELNLKGFKNVGGIDEAGRGPLAGPVCAACVILDKDNIPEGINDSKKLSEKKREALFDKIMDSAIVSSLLGVPSE